MKTKIYNSFLLIGFALTVLSLSSLTADCENPTFVETCSKDITGYKFLKSNKINIAAGAANPTVNISQVFAQRLNYILTGCTGGAKIKVSLFDNKKKLIMSNYNEEKKTYYPSITYKCLATGVYYITYEFDKGEPGCGAGIIGFVKF